VIDNNPARGLARVILELDGIVNQWTLRPLPPEVWKRLRELRAEAFVEFERWAGKSVGQVLGLQPSPKPRLLG
jgi:hypothetical protein